MALIGNIQWYRGDSYPIELTVKDKENSTAIDITGYSFLLTMDTLKDPPDDTTKLFEVSGIVDVDQVVNKGKVTFTPTAINTDQSAGAYFYDVQMTDVSGNIRTIAKYNWKMVQDISK